MAYCVKCGANNPTPANFCHECGEALFDQPASPKAPHRRSTILLVVINVLLLAAIQAGLLFVTPVFAAMYADFGSALPRAAQLLIAASDFWRNHWLGLNVALVAFAIPVQRSARRTDIRLWLVLAAIVQGLLLMAMFISLALPIAELSAVASGIK